MNEKTEPKKAKPGLMIEDHNAIVEADESGVQHVRKVPDRAAEAERKGVDESQL